MEFSAMDTLNAQSTNHTGRSSDVLHALKARRNACQKAAYLDKPAHQISSFEGAAWDSGSV